MTATRPPATVPAAAAPRRWLVEACVGALLVLVALVTMVFGGRFSVATSDAAGVRPAGAATPALVLQCPLGVHRLPLGSRPERGDA